MHRLRNGRDRQCKTHPKHGTSTELVKIAHQFRAVQCDQTTVLATLRIMCREEVGQSLQGRVCFVLRVRLQRVNNIDCSCGAFSAWWRGLGIFAMAPLTRLPDTAELDTVAN
jgi:hypothetical protein